MKYILSFCMLLLFGVGYAQEMTIDISAGKKSITINLDDDNINKTLLISPGKINAKNNHLTAEVNNDVIDTSWNRSFMLYDSSNTEVATLSQIDNNKYSTGLISLISIMKKNENYFLYTIVHPKDLQKAMLVKVARSLVCKIKLDN